MSKDLFKLHMQRLRAGANQAVALNETSRWISDNTFINGKNYSYVDHEYQQRILDSTARETNTRKCSQVGISELSIRKALALCGMIKNFTTIYTLPTAGFAATVSKTRVAPVIRESPYLNAIQDDTDNVEVKQFKNGSFLYLKGAASSNAPISIPCSYLVHDEWDFSDPQVLSQYQSRITHSEWKMKHRLSTPTIPGKGIDFEFQRSKRFFNFVKCCHCNHQFIPDYYEHVQIPGFTGDLRSITKRNLHSVNHLEAVVICPSCGKIPDLGPAHREWVCENPSENHIAEGFQVSPFDAPKIITPAYLIEASTNYVNVADFVNFNLGLPYFSSESVLSPAEVSELIVPAQYVGGMAVMGVDLGMICHVIVASTSYDGAMQVIHKEKVPLQMLKQRYKELRLQHRVRLSVIDSLPYTDTVLALQAMDKNLYASVYTQSKGVDLFTVKKREEDEGKGMQKLRQINVNRNKTFSALMAFMRSGQFSVLQGDHDAEFVEHCTDMRRVKDWDAHAQEVVFNWVKSEQGNDHFWFALSYAFLAKHIIGASENVGVRLAMVSKIALPKTMTQ